MKNKKYYNLLTHEERKLFKYNYKNKYFNYKGRLKFKKYLQCKSTSFQSFLYAAFVLSVTPQGFNYWNNLIDFYEKDNSSN